MSRAKDAYKSAKVNSGSLPLDLYEDELVNKTAKTVLRYTDPDMAPWEEKGEGITFYEDALSTHPAAEPTGDEIVNISEHDNVSTAYKGPNNEVYIVKNDQLVVDLTDYFATKGSADSVELVERPTSYGLEAYHREIEDVGADDDCLPWEDFPTKDPLLQS